LRCYAPVIVLLWSFILLQSNIAFAHNQEEDKPVLRWCLDHFPGFHEFNGRVPAGPSVEVMQELARRAGFTLEYSTRTPVARCFRQMSAGDTDLMTNLNFTEERDAMMYLMPYSERIPESLYLRADDKRLVDQLSQLDPLTLVTIRNYAYHPSIQALIKSRKQHIEVDSVAAGFELLAKGRVDGLVAPTFSSLDVLQKSPHLHRVFRKAPLQMKFNNPQFIFVGLSKRSPHAAMHDLLTKTLAEMMADGTITKLYNKQAELIRRDILLYN
jgi:polar amino acid transport system substrate-binding protein